MIAGAYPFATAASADWRASIMAGRVIPVAVHAPEARSHWHAFFARVLARDPAQRPTGAAELLAAFSQAMGVG